MTVSWKLSQDDLIAAVRLWLDKQGVNAEGIEVKFAQWSNNMFTASVSGEVDEGFSLGPYR
jgi:hypothetical protein